MQFNVGGASIETVPNHQHEGHYDLWVRWTPHGAKQHSLLISGNQAGIGIGYTATAWRELLEHVYEHGRADGAKV